MQHKKANMQTPSKSFFSKLIDSKSPESHRRFVVLVFAANFIAMSWYILLIKHPLTNKDLAVLILEITALTVGGGWASIVADNAFTRKYKKNDTTTKNSGEDSVGS